MVLYDRAHEELSMVFLQVSNLKAEISQYRQNSYPKNVVMAAMMLNFNKACIELSNGASDKSLSQTEVKIKGFENLSLAASLTYHHGYTKNVA